LNLKVAECFNPSLPFVVTLLVNHSGNFRKGNSRDWYRD
jgi:hypothetical protein